MFALRLAIIAMLLTAFAGCATTPNVGSRVWYEDRILEIETAHEHDELTPEEYLSLKNEVDATRVSYQNAQRERSYYRPHYYGSPFSYGYHPYHRHYY